MEFNTVNGIGLANNSKILFTNKKLELTVGANRGFISFDLNTKAIGETKTGRVYKSKVDYKTVKVGNRSFKVNVYVGEILDEVATPKPKATKPAKQTM